MPIINGLDVRVSLIHHAGDVFTLFDLACQRGVIVSDNERLIRVKTPSARVSNCHGTVPLVDDLHDNQGHPSIAGIAMNDHVWANRDLETDALTDELFCDSNRRDHSTIRRDYRGDLVCRCHGKDHLFNLSPIFAFRQPPLLLLRIVAVCIQLMQETSMTAKISSDEVSDSVVISFRAPRSLVTKLDEIASGDQRTRANFIVRTLTNASTLEPAISTIEQILPRLVELDQKSPDSTQTEYSRGLMNGARWMLTAFFGDRAMRWVNREVKQRTHLPMPHILPLEEDGNRYGTDSEADL